MRLVRSKRRAQLTGVSPPCPVIVVGALPSAFHRVNLCASFAVACTSSTCRLIGLSWLALASRRRAKSLRYHGCRRRLDRRQYVHPCSLIGSRGRCGHVGAVIVAGDAAVGSSAGFPTSEPCPLFRLADRWVRLTTGSHTSVAVCSKG